MNIASLDANRAIKNWGSIITYSLPRVLIFTVLSMALLFVLFDHLFPFIRQFEVVKTLPRWLFNSFCAITTILLLLPFLYGIVYNNVKTRQLYSEMSKKNKSNIIVITVWTLIRFLIAGFFVFTVLVKFFKYTKWVILLVTLAVIIFMMFSSRTLKRFTLMESSFMKNLNAKENSEN